MIRFEGVGDSSYSMRGGLQVTSKVIIKQMVNEVAAKTTVKVELSDTEHTANAIKALENYNLAKTDQVADYEKAIRE